MSALAIVLIDHGSRRAEANAQLDELARAVGARFPDARVRVAHLEIAEPPLGEVIDACIAEGAEQVLVHPFFLSPGRHTREDVPRLVDEARARHPGVAIEATGILGLEAGVVDAVVRRIEAARG